jgi:hypothetical protein
MRLDGFAGENPRQARVSGDYCALPERLALRERTSDALPVPDEMKYSTVRPAKPRAGCLGKRRGRHLALTGRLAGIHHTQGKGLLELGWCPDQARFRCNSEGGEGLEVFDQKAPGETPNSRTMDPAAGNDVFDPRGQVAPFRAFRQRRQPRRRYPDAAACIGLKIYPPVSGRPDGASAGGLIRSPNAVRKTTTSMSGFT